MPTINQLIKRPRVRNIAKTKAPSLDQNPFRRGTCIQVMTRTPEKSNSAIWKVTKVRFTNWNEVIAYIPDEGDRLQECSVVLVRGRCITNLPGVRYRVVRGPLIVRVWKSVVEIVQNMELSGLNRSNFNWGIGKCLVEEELSSAKLKRSTRWQFIDFPADYHDYAKR
jgi:small subunit ribosomal protein S12